jgi:hypothetical protein
MELAQFKLVNGEEVICQVAEFPSEDENQYIVFNAFSVRSILNEDYTMSYGLSPWMMLVENTNDYIVVSASHILSIVKPTIFMKLEYNEALKSTLMAAQERLSRIKERAAEILDSSGSEESKSNIVTFPFGKDTIH